jgi:hypothetical protein
MQIVGNLVGMHFRPPAKVAVDNMPASTEVIVQREQDNPHDENACRVVLNLEAIPEPLRTYFLKLLEAEKDRLVMDELEWPLHLGYINRDIAAELAPIMDSAGFEELKATAFINPAGKWQVRVEFDEPVEGLEDH